VQCLAAGLGERVAQVVCIGDRAFQAGRRNLYRQAPYGRRKGKGSSGRRVSPFAESRMRSVSTVTGADTVYWQARCQPSPRRVSGRASFSWTVTEDGVLPRTRTLHLPHVPRPPQAAASGISASRAASRSVRPGSISTAVPDGSNWMVHFTRRAPLTDRPLVLVEIDHASTECSCWLFARQRKRCARSQSRFSGLFSAPCLIVELEREGQGACR